MSINSSKFGQRVRQLRLAKGWTLSDLGDRVGLRPMALSELERAKVATTEPALIEQLALHLEADVDELFVLAGRLPPCLAWVQADPSVVKLLSAMVALIDSRATLPQRTRSLSAG